MNGSCKICDQQCKSIANHVFKQHHITKKDYYDRFYNQDFSLGKCIICNRPTKFFSLERGYLKYCSDICSTKDSAKNLKISKTVSSILCRSKTKNTCLERYGVDHPFKLPSIKEKLSETSIRKYGTKYPSQSEVVKERIKTTCLKKYGEDNPGKVKQFKQKIKETFIRKYGYPSHFNNINISRKIEQYNIEKYGVPYKFQSDGFRKKAMYCGKFKHKIYTNKFGVCLSYQTKLELKFIKKCDSLNLYLENGDVIDYKFKGKHRKYFCDFKVLEDNGKFRLIELKGKHIWWERDKRSGKIREKAKAAIKFSKSKNYNPYKIVFDI